ncbi:MAG: hypothetical protein HY520_03405 [Candidatus Aenigmarchaeota archaeon]|nr:hypothetical protein [Candidatus Aenigmarchaeota archaeon]
MTPSPSLPSLPLPFKVALACGLGGFIGSLVALEIAGPWWWLGMLAGAATAYLAYEFRRALAAIPPAWKSARGWQPDRAYWKCFFPMFFYAAGVGLNWVILFGVLYLLPVGPDQANPNSTADILFVSISGSVLAIMFGLTAANDETPRATRLAKEGKHEEAAQILQSHRRRFIFWNPLAVLFWQIPRRIVVVLELTAIGIVLALKRTAIGIVRFPGFLLRAGKVLARFCWFLFREIHSDVRLLCAADAAWGTLAGFFSGNALIGFLVGGAVGLLNFLLVSVWWLKLVPARQR